ncbi:hypothetical protein [Reyranella sp.]|uniref:SGNH/GDSL hydrolase family protein n=1 Tax=Reyranella sp. TaxID=1929291 RepID=UPI0012219B24|nr:hypothetical protein [Reyranella sp.]TAJ90348.1 MAG: hypothetical protein EPO50_01000 [Reyranella sp.]
MGRVLSDKSIGRVSRLREAGIGLGLVLASVMACLLAGELLVRIVSDDPKRWEWENFVTYPSLAEGRWNVMQPDSLLGYKPRAGYSGTNHGGKELLTFDMRGLRVHRRDSPPPAIETPPVLVLGNSYAMGEEVNDEETFPAHLQDMLDRRVLNGGVAGYGIDQVVLRAEALVPALKPGLLVVSFIGDNVRRAQERVLWGVEKPYFEVIEGGLELRNVPVPLHVVQPIDAFRRIAGHSFLVDLTMDRLGLADYWLAGQPRLRVAAHEQGDRVSCLLMERLRQLSLAHGLTILIVAQYTPLAWMNETTRQFEVQTTAAVLQCAEKSGLLILDTAAAFETAVRADGLDAYYVGGHKDDAGNRLTAKLITDRLASLQHKPF